jgi:hypothetical protein
MAFIVDERGVGVRVDLIAAFAPLDGGVLVGFGGPEPVHLAIAPEQFVSRIAEALRSLEEA